MTLEEFFEEFTTDDLVDMYRNRIHSDVGKDTIKESLMNRLDMNDNDSFELWLELY